MQGGSMIIETLENMVSLGKITQYWIDRRPGWAYITAYYLEYDRDSPNGDCKSRVGDGRTVADALQDLMGKIPVTAGVKV